MMRDTANRSRSDYDAAEIARRRDEVIKRMLNTPPQPRRAKREPAKAKERPDRETRSNPKPRG